MSLYVFGDLLRTFRKQKHISQGDMCRGLCNVAMASRIENGGRVPSRKLIEALFSRIGEVPPYSKIPVTKADFIMRNLEYDIISSVANGNYEIKTLLDDYKTRKNTMTPLEQQFYEFYRAIYIDRDDAHNEESLDLLVNALRISIPDFECYSFPKRRLLTRVEIGLLNTIAHTLYYGLKKSATAISLLQDTIDFLEHSLLNKKEMAVNYQLIAYNLANWLEDEGSVAQSLALSSRAAALCVQYGRLMYLPHNLFVKGVCLARLEKRAEAEQNLATAISIFNAKNQHTNAQIIAKAVNEQFGFSFPTE